MKESGKNLEALLEQTYKNQTIVEQQIVYNNRKRNVDKRLYIITTDRNHEEYTLWLDGNKLGKASNPTELYDKIK